VTVRERLRALVGWAGCIAVVLAIWPATLGGWLSLTIVSGTSMQPTHYTGDMVIGWRTSDYQPGDIVVYTIPEGQQGEGYQIIHRLRSVDADGAWTVRGDNRSAPDPWHPTGRDILGEEIFAIDGAGNGLKFLPIVLALVAGVFVTIGLWPRKRRLHRRSPGEELPPTAAESEAPDDIAAPRRTPGRLVSAIGPSLLAALVIAAVLLAHSVMLANASGLGGLDSLGIGAWQLDAPPSTAETAEPASSRSEGVEATTVRRGRMR